MLGLECPFEVESCSWPRNTQNMKKRGEPEWDSPIMEVKPEVSLDILEDGWYWAIDWVAFFRGNLPSVRRCMRGFTLVFHLKMKYTGDFFFKDLYHDCIVRRGDETLYENHNPQSPTLAKISVNADDHIAIALCHKEEDEWAWGGFLIARDLENFSSPPDPLGLLLPYLQRVQEALRHPNGPPLKFFTACFEPISAVLSIYSLVLNGYVPSEILLFGDHQWSDLQRGFLKAFLPFAHNVPTKDVITHLESLNAHQLIPMATRDWEVMKTAIALLYEPHEFCLMDDDVIILEPLDDALEAFKTHDLVYTTNMSYENGYIETWKSVFPNPPVPLPTRNFNAGLYWLRNMKDPHTLVSQLQQVPVPQITGLWEQGFIALAYADNSFELSSQRYFIPLVDGLPGGIGGYDYGRNPCEFACLHFAGRMKPANGVLMSLLPQILPD
jgi:hypothetical protein